jgi:hypothetical protein
MAIGPSARNGDREHIQEADAKPRAGLACCPQPGARTSCRAPYLVSRIEQTVVAEDPGRASLIGKEERPVAEDTVVSFIRLDRICLPVSDDTHPRPEGGDDHAVCEGRGAGCSSAEGGVPHVVLGVEALDFVQLDLGVLGPVRGCAGDPPLSAGQACGQVCASAGIILLLRAAPLGGNLAMGRLPEPDRARIAANHNSVVPAPDHHGGDTRYLSEGYQMTRQYPLPARRRELRRVPDGDNLAADQDLAGILLGTEHDAAAEPRGNRCTWSRSSHPSSMTPANSRQPGIFPARGGW